MEQPRVLLLSLNLESWFDEMYKPHLDKLTARARVHRVKTATAAIRSLSGGPAPHAVLVTDSALAKDAHGQVYDALLAYVRQGGTAVFMAHFPSFIIPGDMQGFFARAGLPWKSGSYHRTTFTLNNEAVGAALAARLPPAYSQKALSVGNVRPGEAWYRSTEGSRIESRVFAPDSAFEPTEAPVAVGKVGNGRLGYIGDVNVEDETGDVVLAMCGLL
ncbi:hypothetical protein MYCTH_2305342 [Thermothelomyces thermophilus ATCC 42464]|uniref:Uncharacterized protein n=1 Tax=Thermothelomyces thermophilus (strain ATCC 42464 / BCRC 31852 / DSM 1799) TaxID=573729 RepID=G2QCI9_THET4|nr:uncharacterized protein MYCTH_2305342 [Thermothelomyces thermophilus ATCC 42464]AEO58165.1 hypothetical protein MYCTH_2305342 [Thermothelomyces thermophilus ATCC 42464]